MTTLPSTPASLTPRFVTLFLAALVLRFITVGLGIGLATRPPHVLPEDPSVVEVRERINAGSAKVIEPWFRWDAGWMVNIARHGYTSAEDRTGRLGVAFLPAMPATIALAEVLGINPFWFGLIVANVAGAAGAAIFARVGARLLNDRDAGWRAFALLLAFPTAFFYSTVYNESFGLLFTSLALAAWLANKPVGAGLSAMGGSFARMTGAALGVAAILDWLVKRQRRELWRAVGMGAGSFAGLACCWGLLWWAVGDPFAGLKSQGSWGRHPLSIWNPLRAINSIYDPDLFRPDNAKHFAWEAVVVFGFTALGFRAWWKRGTFWGVLTLVPIGQMLASGTLLSANRIILASLPAFIELADLLRHRILFFGVCVCFALGQLTLLNKFVHWQFAG